MLKFTLMKSIGISSLRLAISPNKKFIAASSERCVRIMSLPELTILNTFPVPHTCSMVFSEDSNSLISLTTRGEIFRWSTDGLELLGKWPSELWCEGPLFHCIDGNIALASHNGVSVYNIHTKEFRTIINCSPRVPQIVGTKDNRINILLLNDTNSRQELTRLVVNTNGDVLSLITSNEKVFVRQCSYPTLLSNGNIVLLSASGLFSKQGTIYSFNIDGHVEKHSVVPKEYCVSRCRTTSSQYHVAAAHEVTPHGITIFAQKPFTYIGCIKDSILCGTLDVNPPSDVLFLSDTELLVGTWEKLMLFTIQCIN